MTLSRHFSQCCVIVTHPSRMSTVHTSPLGARTLEMWGVGSGSSLFLHPTALIITRFHSHHHGATPQDCLFLPTPKRTLLRWMWESDSRALYNPQSSTLQWDLQVFRTDNGYFNNSIFVILKQTNAMPIHCRNSKNRELQKKQLRAAWDEDYSQYSCVLPVFFYDYTEVFLHKWNHTTYWVLFSAFYVTVYQEHFLKLLVFFRKHF